MEQRLDSLGDDGIFALEQVPMGDSPVIILAHGINSDLTEDRSELKPGLFELIVDLAGHYGLGTIRFDFRGHGKSGTVGGHVSIRSEVADVRMVLNDAKKRGRQVLGAVAASFGACAACTILPELPYLKSLVLLNPVLKPLETFLEPGSAWARESINPGTLDDLERTGSLLLDGMLPLGRDFIDDLRRFSPADDLAKYKGAVSIVHGTDDTKEFTSSRTFYEASSQVRALSKCGNRISH